MEWIAHRVVAHSFPETVNRLNRKPDQLQFALVNMAGSFKISKNELTPGYINFADCCTNEVNHQFTGYILQPLIIFPPHHFQYIDCKEINGGNQKHPCPDFKGIETIRVVPLRTYMKA
ncbi:MAG TPA: hypothetical protein PKG49_10825 [Nitrosomonas mobilis]|nr:hypothetical protein [Nitrosomonas mobilis]